MKNLIFTLLFFSFLSIFFGKVHAQIISTKWHGLAENAQTQSAGGIIFGDFVETSSGDFWVLNGNLSLSQYILKTNRAGEAIFPLKKIKLNRLDDTENNIAADHSGGLVRVFLDSLSKTKIERFRPDGSLDWEIENKEANYSYGNNVILKVNSENEILLFCSEVPASAWFGGKVFLYDLTGKLLAIRKWGEKNSTGFTLTEICDGKFALMNRYFKGQFTIKVYNFKNEKVDSLVVKMPDWASNTVFAFSKLQATEDGGFLILPGCCDVTVIKVDFKGKVEFVWKKNLGKISVEELPGRGFVVRWDSDDFYWYQFGGNLAKLYFLSPTGELLSEDKIRGFAPADHSNPNFLPGYTFRTWNTTWKTDAFGLNFMSVHFPTDLKMEENRLEIFPNPSADLFFGMKTQAVGLVAVEVFSENGQLVFTQNLQKTVEFETFFLSKPDLPTGTFFVSARLGEVVFSGKWVKI